MNEDYHFQSLGDSAFVDACRRAIDSAMVETHSTGWNAGGRDSLTVEFEPATRVMEQEGFEGLKAQIWMARPSNGEAACKFEVMSCREEKHVAAREKFADSIMEHLVASQPQLPHSVIAARGSTIVKCRLSVPAIEAVADDTPENIARHVDEIAKVVIFFTFLDSALHSWVVKAAPSSPETRTSS